MGSCNLQLLCAAAMRPCYATGPHSQLPPERDQSRRTFEIPRYGEELAAALAFEEQLNDPRLAQRPNCLRRFAHH